MELKAPQAFASENTAAVKKSLDQQFVPGISPAMRAVQQVITDIAGTDIPVLVIGESGTGKEIVALHVHHLSRRRNDAFRKLVCGALTPESFDSILYGHNHDDAAPILGTLFLDEIGELNPACQSKLVHAFPDSEAMPQGGSFNARVICSTSRVPEELEEEVRNGRFRKDLYYRVNGVCLRLPPLRERREDIPALAEHFLGKNSELLGRPQPSLSAQTLRVLLGYSWPGNIRELENTIRKIVALGDETLAVTDLESLTAGSKALSGAAARIPLKQASREASRQAEKELILNVLTRTHWNRKRAAQQLQISYKALLYKLRQMGLDESGPI